MSNNIYLNEILKLEKSKLEKFLKHENNDYEDIVSLINTIIDLKILINYNENDSVYLDLKKMIKYYILAVENKECGYDKVNVDLVCCKINKIELRERQNLFYFFKRELLKKSFLDESIECENYIYNNKILILKQSKKIKDKIKLLFLMSSKNIINLITSFLIIFLIIYIIQLKAPVKFMEFYSVNYLQMHSNVFLNDISNILIMLINLNDEVSLKPTNILAIIFLGFLKLLYVSLFVNYFWKKIIDYIKIKE